MNNNSKFPKPFFQYTEADYKLLHQLALDYMDYMENVAQYDDYLIEGMGENLKQFEEFVKRIELIKGHLIFP